VVLSGEYK